jgi:hypothetical protein
MHIKFQLQDIYRKTPRERHRRRWKYSIKMYAMFWTGLNRFKTGFIGGLL